MIIIKPRVSVIIPTLNAASDLPILLEKLKGQTTKVLEIIVVDSQSTDSTIEIARNNQAKVINILRKEFDHGRTRNYAALTADGDILVFMTQDALPENEKTIENLITPLEEPEILVSYARQIPKPNTKVTDKFLRQYNYPPQNLIKTKADIKKMGIKTFQNSNVCAAYQRKGFQDLGGFPAPIVSNEDMLFAAKAIFAGYKVVYCADARVLHSHNYNYSSLFKRYFDIGASLDNEPLLAQVGKAESKGLDFLTNQIKYIIADKQFTSIHQVLLEAIFKYAGYKLGEKHRLLPPAWKKYLGLHKAYWNK